MYLSKTAIKIHFFGGFDNNHRFFNEIRKYLSNMLEINCFKRNNSNRMLLTYISRVMGNEARNSEHDLGENCSLPKRSQFDSGRYRPQVYRQRLRLTKQ